MNGRPSILIVEDDLDQVEAYKVVLASRNYEILEAYCPEQGWDKVKADLPDLIILDVMFGLNEKSRGLDLAVRLKRDPRLATIPVLMITSVNTTHLGYNLSPEIQGAMLPVDCFLDKPVDPDILLEKVEVLIDQKISKWREWPKVTE